MDAVRAAKDRLLELTEGVRWRVSVGIRLVDGQAGLIVSVQAGFRGEAESIVRQANLGVPVLVREMATPRAR